MTTHFVSKSSEHDGIFRVTVPDADVHSHIAMMPGVNISLDFDPYIAKYTQEGYNLVLSFANDSTVTLTGFFAVDEETLPYFILPDGTCVFAKDVLANADIVRAYDWIGKHDGGMEEYRDNAGVLIDSVERLGFLGTDHWDQGFDGGNNDDIRRYVQSHAFEPARAGDGRGENDTLYGDEGNDILFGQGGNDILFGGGGYDILVGGTGDDILTGGSGNDIIYGGTGDDILLGGVGADVFVWTENDLDSGTDKVMDFSFAEGDKLDFSDLLSPGETLEDLLGMLSLGLDTDNNRLSVQVSKGEKQMNVSINVQGDELQSFIDTYVEQQGDTAGLNDALLTMMIQNGHG